LEFGNLLPAALIIDQLFYITKLIGSRFKVQRLQPMDTVYYTDQDPEYPTYPLDETAL